MVCRRPACPPGHARRSPCSAWTSSARHIPTDGPAARRGAPRLGGIGDVTGRGAFTHVSMYQAAIVIADILGRSRDLHEAEYRARCPRVTSSARSRDRNSRARSGTASPRRSGRLRSRIGLAQVPASGRGWIHKSGNKGFILKLVADDGRGVLVGATAVGVETGGEVLEHVCSLARRCMREIPVRRLSEMIYAYPTFHETVSGTPSAQLI